MAGTSFFRFDSVHLPPETGEIRAEVREFLKHNIAPDRAGRYGRTWSGFDADFSRKMGEKGWIGMTWPKEYGGHERTSFERYVVLEEMLAGDGSVAAHWIADRQSGPLLLNFGTEEQRQKYLPPIARGESYFCIGMSEPDSGSDLASVRTKAEKVDGGYKINGRKIWTSNAHKAHYMIAIFRTSTDPDNRHAGLTQFIVDLKTPGITIREIPDLTQDVHFNEVTFDDVFVPDDCLVGSEGSGWKQVTAELAFERSGPERYLSAYRLVVEAIRRMGDVPSSEQKKAVGRLVAHMLTLRRMSISVAGMLQEGENPALEASVVKDLGTAFEQEIPHIAHALIEAEPVVGTGQPYEDLLVYLTQISPTFSLRGGTREILRGIIARGLGLR